MDVNEKAGFHAARNRTIFYETENARQAVIMSL